MKLLAFSVVLLACHTLAWAAPGARESDDRPVDCHDGICSYEGSRLVKREAAKGMDDMATAPGPTAVGGSQGVPQDSTVPGKGGKGKWNKCGKGKGGKMGGKKGWKKGWKKGGNNGGKKDGKKGQTGSPEYDIYELTA